jgi:hypothetical protein
MRRSIKLLNRALIHGNPEEVERCRNLIIILADQIDLAAYNVARYKFVINSRTREPQHNRKEQP